MKQFDNFYVILSLSQLLEEEEKKQKEREAQLLASLGSQGVPAYKVQVKWTNIVTTYKIFNYV